MIESNSSRPQARNHEKLFELLWFGVGLVASVVLTIVTNSANTVLTIFVAVAGGIGAFVPLYALERAAHKRVSQATEDPSERLRHRIDAVNNAFTQANVAFVEAANLMDELRRDLVVQESAHRELVADAERQRRLIDMDREEAEAVQALILGSTRADARRQRRREWIFFGAGLLFSIPINILSDLIGPR